MVAEPKPAQAQAWNNASGRTWVDLQALLDRMFADVGAAVVAAGSPSPGERFLDIGCGAGATTLATARALGPGGSCLGVDISRPLIEAAQRNAAAQHAANAGFITADAQVHAFDAGGFDGAISRFGVMFFDDPVAAFRNVRRAVRPGGRLAFAAWRSPSENPFMTTAAEAAAPFLPDLSTPLPNAPGQFGLARREWAEGILSDAGWTEIAIRELDVGVVMPLPDLATYAARMGPVGAALQAMDEEARTRIGQIVLEAFDRFVSDGAARFNLACWLVTAQAPAEARR